MNRKISQNYNSGYNPIITFRNEQISKNENKKNFFLILNTEAIYVFVTNHYYW